MRKVPTTGEVYELLRECAHGKGPEDFVFTRAGGQRVVDPREEWYSLCAASGLGKYEPAKRENGQGLTLHDFKPIFPGTKVTQK